MPGAAAAILLPRVKPSVEKPTKENHKTEGIPEKWNWNSNQSLTFSGFFCLDFSGFFCLDLPVRYTLFNLGKVLCTVESTLMVLPCWLPRVFVSANCLAAASTILVRCGEKVWGKIAGELALPPIWLLLGHHTHRDSSWWCLLWFKVTATSYIWVKVGYYFMESTGKTRKPDSGTYYNITQRPVSG